jgi:hypothetical protein
LYIWVSKGLPIIDRGLHGSPTIVCMGLQGSPHYSQGSPLFLFFFFFFFFFFFNEQRNNRKKK